MEDCDEERLTAFIESMKVRQTPFLAQLEKEALGEGVPIIRPQTQALIQFLLAVKKPGRILEVGAAVGYSSLFMQEYAPEGTRITTIEKDAPRAARARENYEAYRKGKESTAAGQAVSVPELLEGDAAEILPSLPDEAFDFIFMDAAKGQYIHFLPAVKRLLACGGVLLSDNILRDGEVLESKFAVTRRNRTIHKRMREYLDALTKDPELITVVLGTGDGAAMSVKNTAPGSAGL